MRLWDIKSILRKPVLMACAMMLAGGGISCQNNKDSDVIPGNFLNPGDIAVRQTRNTLQIPILSTLSGLEEPNEEFPTARKVIADDLKVDSADYIIGKNDLIQITLTDVTPGVETAKTSRVSESGNISLPLIGQIQAAGLTEAQLEKAIQKAYQDSGIVKNAQVSVTVIEARQRTFQVRGAVARAGQYQIVQSDFRMLDAMVLAGDVQIPGIEWAYVIRPPAKTAATQPSTAPAAPARPATGVPGLLEPKPRVEPGLIPAEKTDITPSNPKPTGIEDATRPTPAGDEKPLPVFVNGDTLTQTPPAPAPGNGGTGAGTGAGTNGMPSSGDTSSKTFDGFNAQLPEDQSTIIKVPLRQLLNGDLRYNIVIRPQDTIVVVQPEAGEYYMGGHVARVGVYSLTGRQITLKQAIISAGMLDELAVPSRTEIIRRIGRDREVFVRLNIAMVFNGTQSDIFLKPYDIVQVGTNAVAPFLSAVRNAFRITYGFGFLYDRNFYNPPTTTTGR